MYLPPKDTVLSLRISDSVLIASRLSLDEDERESRNLPTLVLVSHLLFILSLAPAIR